MRTAEMNSEGIGLGLMISKSLIEANGGALDISSDGFGKGATFKFSMRMKLDNADGQPVALLSESSSQLSVRSKQHTHRRNDSFLRISHQSLDKERLLIDNDAEDDEKNVDKLLQLASEDGLSGNLMDNLSEMEDPTPIKMSKDVAVGLNKSPFLNESSDSKVLLIEDDQLNIEAMRRLLLQFNLELSWATSGSVALEMVRGRLARTVDSEDPAYMY